MITHMLSKVLITMSKDQHECVIQEEGLVREEVEDQAEEGREGR
jgi:hypothetical protein